MSINLWIENTSNRKNQGSQRLASRKKSRVTNILPDWLKKNTEENNRKIRVKEETLPPTLQIIKKYYDKLKAIKFRQCWWNGQVLREK